MVKIIPDIIRNSAKKLPDKTAFKYNRNGLNYTEVEVIMNQIAHALIKLNVHKGDRVGVYLHRSLESVLAVYGILNAGAVFVPLNVNVPPNRVNQIIEDAGITTIISSDQQKEKLAALISTSAHLNLIGPEETFSRSVMSWTELYTSSSVHNPEINIQPDDLAYIMYTSGSTGTPKGIMHSHYSGLSYARLSSKLYSLSSDDRVASHSTLTYDISTFSYFSSPLAGATTIIVSDLHCKMPASLSLLIKNNAITVWYSVPLALIQLLEYGALKERDISSLRWVLFGGESFSVNYLNQLITLWPQTKFSNVYGPAEINQCTYYHIDDKMDEKAPIPLGEIWGETSYLIVNGNDVSPGPKTLGELLINSPTMMKGYWNNQKNPEEIFYTHPGNGKKYYRTGDLVKQDDKGRLVFYGRKDRQVKVQGYRVELEEVESLLLQHDNVRQVAVFISKNGSQYNQINAGVVFHQQENAQRDLHQYALSKLPGYAVPSVYLNLENLPRSASGKVDYEKMAQLQSEQNIDPEISDRA